MAYHPSDLVCLELSHLAQTRHRRTVICPIIRSLDEEEIQRGRLSDITLAWAEQQ